MAVINREDDQHGKYNKAACCSHAAMTTMKRSSLVFSYPNVITAFLIKSSSCLALSASVHAIHFPLASTNAHGHGLAPLITGTNICNSGNALPIPSPSTTGSPSDAPSVSGSMQLRPPTSALISATMSEPAGSPAKSSDGRQIASSPDFTATMPSSLGHRTMSGCSSAEHRRTTVALKVEKDRNWGKGWVLRLRRKRKEKKKGTSNLVLIQASIKFYTVTLSAV